MKTLGIHHLGLSVSDLDGSTEFFVECLGWTIARQIPEYPARFVTNGESFLTLWQTNEDARSFDRKEHVGLHHVAIRVASEADLLDVYERVANFDGVKLEFAVEHLRGGPAQHFMVYEPSGIRVEFIWVP